MTYAILENGGKQYKVKENDVIMLEKMKKNVEESIELKEIVMLSNGDGEVKVGTPYLENAKITAKVLEHGKGEKAIIFKKKRRKDYKLKRSHRQPYTKVLIEKIEA